MSLLKHEIPILEYDSEPQAVIMPNRKKLYSFPMKAVFAFLLDEIEKYALDHHCEKIGEFESITKRYPIYKAPYKGHDVCLCQAPMGASPSTQILDFLIGYGVQEIIATGCCGDLIGFAENEFLVPVEALRDEGTSYHYLPPSRTIKLNQRAVNAIKTALDQQGIQYELCKTWTTDGFYRETVNMVHYRKEEGCSVVDMECSALAACAAFRDAIFGQILFTADTLANIEDHDERDWGLSSFSLALKVAMDAVCEI